MEVPSKKLSWSPPRFDKEEKEAAIRVVNSGWVTQGRETKAFEKELSEYFRVRHAVVMNNGTSALIASLIAHGIGPGDEVIVPSYTFIATVNSILAVGAKPVLADSDPETWVTTPELVKEKITGRTKAIMPVDVGGGLIDSDGFEALAQEKNITLIEDAAHLPGAKYKGKIAGSYNHTWTTSFHMAKLALTIEGGAVFTNDDKLAELLSQIRNHGMSAPYDVHKNIHYDYTTFGLNFRITDIQSAIGRVQLSRLEDTVKFRNQAARIYMDGMPQFRFQKTPEYQTRHPYMFFGMLVNPNKRMQLIQEMVRNGVDIRICWRTTHLQPYHSQLFKGISLPNSEMLSDTMLCPPLGNDMTLDDTRHVVEVVNKIWGKIK
ncbi:MAG: pyridoxal phosphate-dependent enzyme [archaeon GW2011_AR3]|nr:MAG: pyridoxal phosphate-dependent enzyme [archaeon GW2011_AR3]MBS3109598.1 DegT/DnrJ/EryC1/StrS family aminotransferase [Candidatus Woesearchaeota archaeon]